MQMVMTTKEIDEVREDGRQAGYAEGYMIGFGCGQESPKVSAAMVDRFLTWPLPASVCSDPCATTQGYPHRAGTNLLTADEARAMLE